MFENVNLEDELNSQRDRSGLMINRHPLDEVYDVLADSHEEEGRIYEQLWGGNSSDIVFSEHGLDPDRIYDLQDIKEICVQYRLRFLDTKHYKGEIPYDAILAIKREQERLGQRFENFKIVAPSRKFELEDCDLDPMLFLALGANKYYLLHRWGNDMSWYRKLLVYPLRSVGTVFKTIIAISLLAAIFIPEGVLISNSMMVPTIDSVVSPEDMKEVWAYRGLFFIYALLVLSAFTALVGMQLHVSPSDMQWNNNLYKQP